MAEALDKESVVPISKLTLGAAESFLHSIMCLPEITNIEQGISFNSNFCYFIYPQILILKLYLRR